MKIYKLCLIFCTITFVIQGLSLSAESQSKSKKNISTQQRPPLSVNPNEDCHIADAVPLLMKKDYISVGYKLMKLQNKPLIIEEKISVDKFLDLKIEQRGCEDIYAKFNFTFKEKRNRGIKYNLSKAAQLLKNLKINSDTLLSSKRIVQIANTASAESKKAKPLTEKVVCLSRYGSECFTDVALKYKYPNLQLFYVDRP